MLVILIFYKSGFLINAALFAIVSFLVSQIVESEG